MSQHGNEVGQSLPPEQSADGSLSDNDNDKTIVEQQAETTESVAELKKEISALKSLLENFMKTAGSSPSIEAAVSLPADTYPLPYPTIATTTSSGNNLQSLSSPYTPASHPPMQQKLSIGQYQFNPNLHMPYFPATYMPQPSVCTNYLPPIISTTTAGMSAQYFQMSPKTPPSSQQTHFYVPPTSQPQNTCSAQTSLPSTSLPSTSLPPTYAQSSSTSPPFCHPPSQQPPYESRPSASTFSNIHGTGTTNNLYETTGSAQQHRPIRKLSDLPDFNGQPEQWPMFAVAYKETTQAYNYTKLENLTRLQKALKGEAKAKVEAYLIHPESVDQVMSTLEFHYGRPQIMIRSQIAKVRSFPAVTGKKMSEIINLSTLVSNLTNFLENAGATMHLCNPTLLEELVNKLPLSKREEWIKYSLPNLGQYPSVRQFSEWLHNVATYLSLATETDFSQGDSAPNKSGRVKPSFAITTSERQQPSCYMCSQNHNIYHCSKFKSVPTPERWKVVKDNRLCFGCLRAGHNSTKCNYRRQCGIAGCTRQHNRMLHEDAKNKTIVINTRGKQMTESVGDSTPPGIIDDTNDSSPVTTIVDTSLNKKTLFKYLPVRLKGPKGYANIIAFIDDGSKISLLENGVAKQIGLKGPTSNLTLGWIGGKRSNEMSMQSDLEICNVNENEPSFQMRNVRTTCQLQLPPQTLDYEKFNERFAVLNDVEVTNYMDATPKLLIGLPHVRLVRPHNIINLDENFSVHKTMLGNVLFGSNEENSEATVCVIDVSAFDDIQKQVSDYFALEGFGMRPVKQIISDEDKRAEEILKNTTLKIGSQYETGLLWKKDDFDFNETYTMAYKRLQSVEAKMKKDENLAKWYNDKIIEYISKGYARKLSTKEASMVNSRTWYLPHFVITNVNKGNKRRLVFDAAAVVCGESFNSRIMKGPSKYQPKPLLSILFKFRQRQIGVCGDIREMFHRVNIRDQDQTAQRFLWRGGVSTKPPDVYVMRAMIFGSASSPCSAQYIKNLNAENFAQSDPRAYEGIVECHYVDDYVDSFDTIDSAISVSRSVIDINKLAGFELRGFGSNSQEFCHVFGNKEHGNSVELQSLCKDGIGTEKVLGLFWSPTDDTFCFLLKFTKVPEAVLNGSRIPTKREVLSLTMSIFDPFGFLANMVIRSKMMLQELWRYNLDWNSPIPLEIYKKWLDWYKELQNVQYVKIPRCYSPTFTDPSTIIELHIFVDASEMAFAAAGYWKIVCDGQVVIKFVAGKSKCAPIKPLSIPRLELQAAVLGIRLKEAIVSSHNIKPSKVTFWSDSKTVVQWIQSDCRIYKQFVAHRIAEILEYSEVKQWRWVPGSQNPADDATRPQYFTGKTSTSCWLNGPTFLKDDEEHWPKIPAAINEVKSNDEIRTKFLVTIAEAESLISYDLKSQYYILLRRTCWLYRAVELFKNFVDKSVLNHQPYLTPKEMIKAERFWSQKAQQENFLKEINALKGGNSVPKSSSIYKLNPILGMDGLLRVSGRINNARCVGPSTREPIILPKNNTITKLIVKQYHEDFMHQNQESICAAIRTKFWIPCIRQLVRAAKKNCQLCKNRSAVPAPPLMGQLPEDRLTPFVRPFTYTGIDYLGPYNVAIGRRCEKRWIALFTCMTTRAIHLELAKDLSTDAVILCLRNFMNRRGVPVRIRSDRGTNFIGASKEGFVLNQTKLGNECTRRGVEWVFNTPANPSAGGVWERMVRAVKNVLSFTLKEKTPQVETLISLLMEAENLVNSRPLTHLPIESSESEPLTPNHFLLGCPNNVQTPAVDGKVCLRKQWHILQQIMQTFWKRWVLEYLPDLVRRTKWYKPIRPIRIGDVVVICDSNETRGEWKRGVVVDVVTAADGQVRSAVVKTSAGELRRPASKLAVLDVRGSESP